MKKLICTSVALAVLTLGAAPQDAAKVVKADGTIALKGARIYTMEGDPIEHGTVVFRDGKILAVGESNAVEIPDGAEEIDVSGQVIIPGLIDTGSFLLLARSERGVAGAAHYRTVDGLDHFNERAVEPLLNGVTTTMVMPATTGTARGVPAVVKLPNSPRGRPHIVTREAGVLLSLSSGDGNSVSTLQAYNQYRAMKKQFEGAKKYIGTWEKYYKDLEEYNKKKKAEGKAPKKPETDTSKPPSGRRPRMRPPSGRRRPSSGRQDPAKPTAGKTPAAKAPKEPKKPKRNRQLEVLARVFVAGKKVGGEGDKLPLFVEAHTREEIRFLLKLKEEFELTLTLVGATEAHHEVKALAKAKASVIFGPAVLYGPPRARYRRHTNEAPAQLAAAGIRVTIASLPDPAAGYPTGGAHDASRFLMFSAARTVAGGLDRRKALRAVTIDAAETLGLKDRLGSIFPGKDADLVVLTGEPFDIDTRVSMAFVDGARARKE